MGKLHPSRSICVAVLLLAGFASVSATGEQSGQAKPTAPSNSKTATPPPGATMPATPASPEYVIGPEDVITVAVWKENDLSGDFIVRPDGRISLLLVNDVQAAGLTTEQLRAVLAKAFQPFVDAPVSVSIKQINSRKVYITGLVPRPGPYLLGAHLNVVQLISMAGGVSDFADRQNITVLRAEPGPNGQAVSATVNYEDISRGRNLQQNIALKPGDTVIVR
jgi:polysaccharide export outer membrane protein